MKITHPRTKDLTGLKIGNWQIIKFLGYKTTGKKGENSYNLYAHWWCRCDCGLEKGVKAQWLLDGRSKRCKNCTRQLTIVTGTIPEFYWRHRIAGSNRRKIPFNVSKEHCYNLLVAQNFKCSLSGLDIKLADSSTAHRNKETTASLDRIDSSKGYEEGNVQWIHKDINIMKGSLTEEYFLMLCKTISLHKEN